MAQQSPQPQQQHQQSSSRLNRLLTLLDTGSTQQTRFAAARQIGGIAKSHPQELNPLLRKVSQYLRSRNWDTRVAAAKAIGSIAENSRKISIDELVDIARKKIGLDLCRQLRNEASISSFRSFDINKVLEFGVLLASGGQEYDIKDDNNGNNSKERLARQKRNLRRRLGLDVCEQFMDMNDMIRDEDLVMFPSESGRNFSSGGIDLSKKRGDFRVFRSQRPSARELNLLKRKAKVNSGDVRSGVNAGMQKAIAPPSSGGGGGSDLGKGLVDSATDEDGVEHEGDGHWPFHGFVEQLLVDMFDPIWEVRHGSIMALREILTYQGSYAGVSMTDSSSHSGGHVLGSVSEKANLSVKRDRGIDLNLDVQEDRCIEGSKRVKVEVTQPVTVQIGCKVEQNGETGSSQFVPEANIGSVIMNSESDVLQAKSLTEGGGSPLIGSVDVTEKKGFAGKVDVVENLGRNPDLMNLAGSVRNSWLRNCEFLQDCAICFLCVLSLDRFGDYVSDQVVAPVRETCAQALGAVLKYMAPELVRETMNILLQMQMRPEWEIRHGSLLGIKYLIAVRQEMLSDLLGFVLPACKSGLEDPDDDVRAVAADALIPAASTIVSNMDQLLHPIVMLLWDILLDLDDLSPSTSSVMNLLAEIYTHAGMTGNMLDTLTLGSSQELDLNEVLSFRDDVEAPARKENPYMLSALAPRLWPFMRHTITSVRYSAIRTLERLLEARYRKHTSEPSANSFWPSSILGDTLRIVFQNLLLESNDDILLCSERVWRILLHCPVSDLVAAARSHISSWLELATTPYGSELDISKMFWPVAPSQKRRVATAAKMRAVKMDSYGGRTVNVAAGKGIISVDTGDATSLKIVVGADSERSVTRTRVVVSAALGILASKWPESSIYHITDPLWKDVTSLSGVQRQISAMILISWFKEMKNVEVPAAQVINSALFEQFKKWLLDLLTCTDPSLPTKDSPLPYAELSRTYSKMRGEAGHLFHLVGSCGLSKDLLLTTNIDLENLSIDDAVDFASKVMLPNYDFSVESSAENHVIDDVESSRQRLLTTTGYLKCVQSNLHVTVSSLMAAAIVWISDLPARLNPIILPLMASLKREQEEILQLKAAEALAELIDVCIARKPGPNEKLIKNLCSLTCMDPSETPQAGLITSMEVIDEQDLLLCRSMSSNQRSRGRPAATGEDRSKTEGFISRRGAELALKHLCKKFGALLFDKIPKLWDCLSEVLKPIDLQAEVAAEEQKITVAIESVKDPQLLINNIQVVRSVAPLLDDALKPKLLILLPCIFRCVRHSHVAVRLAASRCITTMAKSMIVSVMASVVENAVPMLGDPASVPARQGAGMLIGRLVQGLGVELVPYAPLLVVPLLRCMSDSDASVRQSVTRSFAALVPLLPLARGLPPPAGINDSLLRDKEDAKFLEQLLDNSSIDDYKLCTELKVTLRRYQQEGVNWLAFLRRFKLHGILCDDMGLGKTLQASAIVASDIAEYRTINNGKEPSPSLIVCPSTLVGHWAYEIEKFIDPSVASTLQYVGSAEERIAIRSYFNKHNVIITSYDVVRKDVDFLGQLRWNYCVLDEGHIIKNARSKITTAVKQLKAQNRLILSGTPIQNNILDLWSLFDFLMPGFLGSERQFQATYGKPLLAARDPKCSAKDAEAGALAMEALHKQVMPFLLRRTKDEVLSDLPEKIIQDRYCDLSPVQLKLYEQFSGSHAKKEISSIVGLDDSKETKDEKVAPKASSHIFQALQYLLKLCSHPLLVVSDEAVDSLGHILSDILPNPDILSELHKLHHSPKLIALQEILEECGIGVDTSNSESMINVGQHRVLIFAQHKALLDIIERDLFRAHMRNVAYLRLDGSVHTEKRFDIVKAFNSDPTIDVLLLTTHVGGLGLNLTSADTLVFMEHDWNPMRDLQAMDRAHRLGQKKVVNVHRLIMRGTLEEKVMSLQKFKVSVANSVINADNASLKTMNTDQLLDLFTPAENSRKGGFKLKSSDGSSNENKPSGSGKGLKAILNGLEELWDQSQYTEEYNLDHFLSKLNS
ncbi:TATA-binding protein-associated factor BTAF1 [Amaranthus tricolor]|uniref:TATA-binding protein-associated factor BTAF1 n=1 Tax=Amaranthus tricolor TaxID=29722 RepID=UPI00258EE95F|nr:TATA-binding protein-associated factor BTAF1 [Amaranthus tricolor]XP_057544193.1 TATA-binding protein-associated factor BTAF1 [Amaranthus tricolor]XP_057544194.1 TATA-binding protein-associated factor BTAF1 [Amaranthus tricolor]XP_057544195.1 TATA-binding protein-associated factor BTAF1 [Amaranthus tricolor]XP_057544196.1 TATA-binding protein-associated factor BTAF1 [Amaranthus tricolor]XP_057544197.1 TATA-binding protein-associated factor BTAF1 [Amaranthus tricolor]